jgi:hypothetical protein
MSKAVKALVVAIGIALGVGAFLAWAKANVEAQDRGAMKFVAPFRITLVPVESLDWKQAKQAQEVSLRLKELGYLSAGKFDVPELSGFEIWGFCHPASGLVAILFEDQGKLKAEIGSTFSDGRIDSFSNAAVPVLDLPPYLNLKRFEIDLSTDPGRVEDLHKAALASLGERTSVRCTVEGFDRLFIDTWAREMDWRIENGGISEAEAERLLKFSGIDHDPNLINWLRRGWEMKIAEFREQPAR